MTPERHARLKRHFLEIEAQPPSVWAAEAARLAEGDVEMERELRALLAEHERTNARAIQETGAKRPDRPTRLAPEERSRLGLDTRTLTRWLARRSVKVGIIVAATTLVVGSSTWSFIRLRSTWRDMTIHQLSATLGATERALDSHVARRKDLARRLADDPEIVRAAKRLVEISREGDGLAARLRAAPEQDVIRARMELLLRTVDVNNFVIADTILQVLSTNRSGLVGARLEPAGATARRFSQIVRGSSEYGAPRRFGISLPPSAASDRKLPAVNAAGKSDPRFATTVGAPILSESGLPLAILALTFDAETDFSPIFVGSRGGASVETYAFDADGVLLTASRFEPELRTLGLLADGEVSMLRIAIREPQATSASGERSYTRLASAALASRPDASQLPGSSTPARTSGVITEPYSDYRGVDVVGAWRWLPDLDIGIATEIDAAEIYAPLRYVYVAFGVMAALLAISASGTIASSFAMLALRRRVRSGKQLGAYLLLDKIGEGGLGQVFVARHALLRRRTAIKILRPEIGDAETQERFEREALATSQLTHPNTVTLYDFGRTPEGGFYYVMEYVEGITLSKLIELEGRLQPARAMHILRQIVRSLEEAHLRGLVHRDVKPLNIMVGRLGASFDMVKVLDFGLVKDLRQDQEKTHMSLRAAGTPLYMAPERFSHPNAAVDPRVDVYAVGAVAYKMLSGRNLFDAPSDLGLLYDVVNTPPKPLDQLSPDTPPALVALVMRTLSKDPAARPADARALRLLFDDPVLLSKASPWTEADAQGWWDQRHELLVTPPWWV